MERPAPVVTAKSGGQWKLRTGANSMVSSREGSRAGDGGVEPYERDVDRPAPTVDTKAAGAWRLHPTAEPEAEREREQPRLVHPGRSYGQTAMRSADEPAPTVALGHNQTAWCWERPATTIMNIPRVFPADGHHPESGDPSWSTLAVPVELWELGVLQGFPEDHPWTGTKEQQARSIGNAIPVPLATAILDALIGEGP